MGTGTPALRRRPGRQPERILTISTHIFHVYRHVDIEKLQSKTRIAPNVHVLTGFRARNRVAKLTVFHAQPSTTAIPSTLGGPVWNA